MRVGTYVIRKKYKGDILFKIKEIKDDLYILEGVYIRLKASAYYDDLIMVSLNERSFLASLFQKREKMLNDNISYCRHLTGKILHLDSDLDYLLRCHKLYEKLGLFSVCIVLEPALMSSYVQDLVKDFQIDIVVLTGHDSYNQKGLYDLANYQATSDYIKALIKLRALYSKDDLYIYAGACGSNFEALIAYGANAASSPKRVNIDAYDPAICAIKAATTPFDQIISFDSIWMHSLTKEKGISGIESYGKMRILR